VGKASALKSVCSAQRVLKVAYFSLFRNRTIASVFFAAIFCSPPQRSPPTDYPSLSSFPASRASQRVVPEAPCGGSPGSPSALLKLQTALPCSGACCSARNLCIPGHRADVMALLGFGRSVTLSTLNVDDVGSPS